MTEGTAKPGSPIVDSAKALLQVVTGKPTEAKSSPFPPELLSAFKTNNKHLKSLIESFNNLIAVQEERQAQDDSSGDEAKQALTQEKPKEVVIAEIKEPVLEKIVEMLKGLGISAKSAAGVATPASESSSGSALSGIFNKMLGPIGSVFSKVFGSALIPLVAGLAGSLALAVGSWFNEGPFKGLMKEVGKLGVDVFLPKVVNLASKLFPALAKFLGPIAKKLPVIGFIINLGSAISRVIAGDVVGGLIDLASGMATFLGPLGLPLSIGLGFLNAARDLSATTESTKKGDTTMDTGLTVLVKTVAPFLAKIASKLKFFPIIGNILSIGLAFQSFKQGGIKGWSQGILNLISGIAGFVPGVGTVVSYVAAGLSFLIDLMSGGEEKKDEKKEEVKPGASKGIFSMIGSFIGDKVKNSLRYLPGVGTLIQLGEAFDNFKSGKIKDGFKSLLKAGLTLIPGVGSVISWLMEDKMEEPKTEGATTTEKFDASTIYKAITDGVKDKFKTILKNIKKLPFVPNVVVDKIASYLDIDIGDKAKPEARTGAAGTLTGPALPAQPEPIDTAPYLTAQPEPIDTAPYLIAQPEPIDTAPYLIAQPEPIGSTPYLTAQQNNTNNSDLIPSGKLPLAINEVNSIIPSMPKRVVESIEQSQVPASGEIARNNQQIAPKKDRFDEILNRDIGQMDPQKDRFDEILNREVGQMDPQKDRFGGVFKESKDGYPITQRAADIAIPLQPNTNPRVPLESPIASLTGMPGFDISKKLDELIAAVQTIRGGESSNNSAASINSSTGGSSVTNVFNNGTERDIPYTERTKYRNQIMYSRALL